MTGTVQEIIKNLQERYSPETVLFVDIWGVEDVECVNRDFEITESVTKEQCEEVLRRLDKNYSASDGVCWDTINYQLGEVLEDEA